MIIQERKQIGLADLNSYAVQRIASPQVVGALGLEPAEHRRRSPGGRTGEAEPVEVALQGALVGRPAELGTQDCRGGAIRVLPPQRHRQLEHFRWGARCALAWVGHQSVEPAGTPVPYPTVDALARDPHPPPERVNVLAGRQIAHHLGVSFHLCKSGVVHYRTAVGADRRSDL
jgi:hypothetical protein